MNGAESLVRTLLSGGVEVCFANPGTSEMHFVAALDQHPDLRCVLCLFEGGTSGAADGYYRMKGEVAGTLLHLAAGFGNAFANLHNAKKAGSGILNIVGDHATHHLKYESPLRGDVPAVTRSISHWQRTSTDSGSVAMDGAAALRAARSHNGQIATLVLPADTAWEDAPDGPATVQPAPPLRRPSVEDIKAAAVQLRSPGASLMVDHNALSGELSILAAKVAAKAGCELLAPFLTARIQRGGGTPKYRRLGPTIDMNLPILKDTRSIVLCGASRPVSFFAYPGKPSVPEPSDCTIIDLCGPEMDYSWTIESLADELDAHDATPELIQEELPEVPSGPMDLAVLGRAFAALIPEDAIVVDESITSGRHFINTTVTARRHDVLHNTGGSIGIGLPLAVGASIASPDRKTIVLSGDGSAMYTLQSMWTMARENLDVTIIVFANRGYQVLRGELANVGFEEIGTNALNMLEVANPTLDWPALAKGHGVEAERVEDIDQFVRALRAGLASQGPYLIEVVC